MNQENEVIYLYVDDIIPNRFQPREIFDEKALNELANSIKEHGVIQPIIVRKVEDRYEIIAGERRYKASILAGLTRIPALVRNMDDKESAKVALLENLQRKNLTPIEEARTFQKILELDNLTQEELGRTMGKSQAAVANKLRLLALPNEVQEALLKEQISERHARSLLNLSSSEEQIDLLNKIINQRMTVKDLDDEIKERTEPKELNINLSNIVIEPAPKEIINIPVQKEIETLEDIAIPPIVEPITIKPLPQVEATEILTNMAPPLITPTEFTASSSIDVNAIKENTEDIIKEEKPLLDLTQLVQPVKEEPLYEEKQPSYKFIPILEEEKPMPVKDTFEINIPKVSNSINGIVPSVENNESEAKSQSLIMEEKSEIRDLKYAVKQIRNEVKELQDSGFVIIAEELDFENRYQIIIKIDKNQ